MAFARPFFAALCCTLAVLTAAPARAASVLPLYLDELIDHATVAFEGTCTGNRTERDAATNLVVTYTTFNVRDVLKGNVGKTYEIKQVGGTLPGENLQFRIDGVPTFAAGESYVVFLAGVSSAGFSSPIGLSQGRFHVKAEADGGHVGNGRDFRDMASRIKTRMPASARARLEQAPEAVRDMDLVEFKQTVRNHLGGGR